MFGCFEGELARRSRAQNITRGLTGYSISSVFSSNLLHTSASPIVDASGTRR